MEWVEKSHKNWVVLSPSVGEVRTFGHLEALSANNGSAQSREKNVELPNSGIQKKSDRFEVVYHINDWAEAA